jgi:hypothetical protein
MDPLSARHPHRWGADLDSSWGSNRCIIWLACGHHEFGGEAGQALLFNERVETRIT